jgi:phosphate transport system protein
MRVRFADELSEIEDRLEDELREVEGVLELIAAAIEAQTGGTRPEVAAAVLRLRVASRRVDADLVAVTAREAPVAGDLRLVLCLMQLAQHGWLVANQFELINEQLALLDPDAGDPQQTARQLALMTLLAGRQVRHATQVFAARDARSAAELEAQDGALDRINRQIFEAAHELDAGVAERELALHYVLIARSLERIGDNAVDIGEQVVFLVSGQLEQFSDASRPKSRASASPWIGPTSPR